jgi:hypothetical protein
MAVTSWKDCGTCAEDSGIGTLEWIQYDTSGFDNNPLTGGELTSNDATFGTSSANAAGSTWNTGATSRYLKCTNFGFTSSDIPAGATIDGIEVEIRKGRATGSPAVAETNIKFVKGGTISGNDFSTATDWTAGSESVDTFGSSTELGGLSWSQSDIVASNFGIALWYVCNSGRFSRPAGSWSFVDQVRMRVHYTVGGGGSRNVGGDMMPFFV